ncbi:hypothetical protein HK405_004045 [Cladochytrium tenue]|nr:hypothetical protein HK405_004045 [Cladochytrium tenue]
MFPTSAANNAHPIATITSLEPGATVHTRLLLVEGAIVPALNPPQPPQPLPLDGSVWITPDADSKMPPLAVSFRQGIFRAMVPLSPGKNSIVLQVAAAAAENPVAPPSRSVFEVTFVPLLQNPPLRLALILGRDSDGRYDDVPDAQPPSGLATAIAKLRLAGYMWAAYTGNEMAAGGFGRRAFRLDEAWLPDSISRDDAADPAAGRPHATMRTTAIVHVLRSQKYTVEDIRDPERAQQVEGASKAGSLFDIAIDVIRECGLGAQRDGGDGIDDGAAPLYVAAMFLDAHARQPDGKIVGHAALGGGTGSLRLAIFGSHTLFAWPANLEDLERCFTDTRPVDRRHCGVDAEGKLYYAAANVGIGAMMHEVGHLYGCPHQESGVMLRDYPRLHRAFTAVDPPGADRDVGRGVCHWHRLDLLRFLDHPAFALPGDAARLPPPPPPGSAPPVGGVTCMGTLDGVRVSAPRGVRLVEIYTEGHEFPSGWLEIDRADPEIVLTERTLRERAGGGGNGRLRLHVIARDGETADVDDVAALLAWEDVPGVGRVFRSAPLGSHEGGGVQTALLAAASTQGPGRVAVRAGFAIDGLDFFVDGGAGQPAVRFGGAGGGANEVALAAGEEVCGFDVRSGAWVDAVRVVVETRGNGGGSARRASSWFGNSTGGSPHPMRCPAGYRLCGVYGRVDSWLVSFGILYTPL